MCRIEKTIIPALAPKLAEILKALPQSVWDVTEEIRLRVNQPLMLVQGALDVMVDSHGRLTSSMNQAYVCSSDDVARTVQLISQNSIYAFEQEIKMGFITIAGGHRVGLAGQAVVEGGTVKTLKNVSSINFRLAKEIKGCADQVMPYLVAGSGRVYSTLVISPPRCGKTTLLRDIVRQLSSGSAKINFGPFQVGVVDERSEIAACDKGVPTVNLGERVDVLDGCPKAAGMLMLIRSMSPNVVVTDELGRRDDAEAVREALHAGVSVITSIHGQSVEDVQNRPFVSELVKQSFFERYVIMTRWPKVGTIAHIVDGRTGEGLFGVKRGVKVCG